MFSTTNYRLLRISKTSVLPLSLLLDREDLAWFNDYTFQEVLAVLKPLLQSRIQLYRDGHLVKQRAGGGGGVFGKGKSNSSGQVPGQGEEEEDDLEDGLEDAGVVLGGHHNNNHSNNNSGDGKDKDGDGFEVGDDSNSISTTSRTGRKRKGLLDGSYHSKKKKKEDRPLFRIRFGFRESTSSEQGGAVLVADKHLGFQSRVKKEEEGGFGLQQGVRVEEEEDEEGMRRRRRRSSTGVGLSGGQDGGGDDLDMSVVLREEDENGGGLLRMSDFPEPVEVVDDEFTVNDQGLEEIGSGRGGRKGKRSKLLATVKKEGGVGDRKPSLQIQYDPLSLHPQTLYIVVRTLRNSDDRPLEGFFGGGVSEVEEIVMVTEPSVTAPSLSSAASSSSTTATKVVDENDGSDLLPPDLDDI